MYYLTVLWASTAIDMHTHSTGGVQCVWPETDIDLLVQQPNCTCGDGSLVVLPEPVIAYRYCGGNFIEGGKWEMEIVDESNLNDNTLTL